MRRPSLGVQQNDEDDLSRLASPGDNVTFSTTNSNSSSSSSSSTSGSHPDNGTSRVHNPESRDQKVLLSPPDDDFETNNSAVSFLPKIIDLEWQPQTTRHQQQNHRKRKERLDSTSSNSQTDRKVVRSSNEEQLTEQYVTAEDTTPIINNEKQPQSVDGEKPSPLKSQSFHHPHLLQHSLSSVGHHQFYNNQHHHHHHQQKKNGGAVVVGGGTQFPANTTITPANDDHYSDGEHERRRSSERFCRSRAPHGRKSSSCSSAKKSSSSSAASGGGGKYLSRAAALSGVTLRQPTGDNNNKDDEKGYKYDLSALKTERRGFSSRDSLKQKRSKEIVPRNEKAEERSEPDASAIEPQQMEVSAAALPWNAFPDEAPVVCPRFSESTFDHVINVSEKFVKMNPPMKKENSIKYVNNENMKTRDIMKKYGTSSNNNSPWTKNRNGPGELLLMIITPEERMRQINGRLTKLKKRIGQYEDGYERDFGRRPEKMDTANDKTMKTVLTEIQKLKRERQVIKNCDVVSGGTGGGGLVTPISGIAGTAAAASMFGSLKEIAQEPSLLSGEMKINKMQETLTDIEMVLQDRRKEEGRVEALDKLTVEQLLQEKTAVQRGLLYLEGMFGRPSSKEERDLARSHYDRYRQIKRMLNRNSSMITAPVDLPTILEHEAMVFTSTNNTPSTDATPPESQMVVEGKEHRESGSADESSSLNDNLHQLSISELWHQLDLVRDEKKVLRRTIKEFEQEFEAEAGRKMLKGDRKAMEETYALYKQKKGRLRLLDALVKKHMAY